MGRPLPLIASVPEIHDRMHMSDVLEFRKGSGFNYEPNLHPAAPTSSLSSGRADLRPSIRSPIFVLSSITEHPGDAMSLEISKDMPIAAIGCARYAMKRCDLPISGPWPHCKSLVFS